MKNTGLMGEVFAFKTRDGKFRISVNMPSFVHNH